MLAKFLGSDNATTVMGLYTFTGDDCNAVFKGKGKVTPLKKLQKAFKQLRVKWEVKEQTYSALEEFTCLMYSNVSIKSINEIRALMLRKMVGDEDKLSTKSKVDFSHLPPCRDSLLPHIDSVHYKLCMWKQSHIPISECPLPQDGTWVDQR